MEKPLGSVKGFNLVFITLLVLFILHQIFLTNCLAHAENRYFFPLTTLTQMSALLLKAKLTNQPL